MEITTSKPLTKKEEAERARLHKRWMLRKATAKEIGRCMELDRQARAAREVHS